MPTEPVLDIPSLVAPIAGAPSLNGSDDARRAYLEVVAQKIFDARDKVEKARKAGNPDDFKEGDPRRETVKKADWSAVVKVGSEALKDSAKDLLLASRMTEALVRLHGFVGLAEGAKLLRELVEKCWDTLYPPIADNDLGVRCAPFEWLDDTVRGSCLPLTIRNLPLVSGDEVAFSWHDWKQAGQAGSKITREAFDKAVAEMAADPCAALAEAIGKSREELIKLVDLLKAKMGKDAPSLLNVREAVQDCQVLIQQILADKRPAAAPAPDKPADQRAADPGGRAAPAPAGTREECYRQLAQAAAKLKELEPHSPIPYLIQRAVKLGALPFPDLIKEIVREQKILEEVAREFGFREPPAAKESPPAAAQKK
jgi:type VI secretion system protein ImpA